MGRWRRKPRHHSRAGLRDAPQQPRLASHPACCPRPVDELVVSNQPPPPTQLIALQAASRSHTCAGAHEGLSQCEADGAGARRQATLKAASVCRWCRAAADVGRLERAAREQLRRHGGIRLPVREDPPSTHDDPDSRPSLEERYRSRADFMQKVTDVHRRSSATAISYRRMNRSSSPTRAPRAEHSRAVRGEAQLTMSAAAVMVVADPGCDSAVLISSTTGIDSGALRCWIVVPPASIFHRVLQIRMCTTSLREYPCLACRPF